MTDEQNIWAFPTNGKRRKPKGKNEHELNELNEFHESGRPLTAWRSHSINPIYKQKELWQEVSLTTKSES